jgi:hypothetical protein
MRAFSVGTAFVLSLIGVWPDGLSEAQEGLTKRDSQGSVTVLVTLTAQPSPGAPIKAKVVLDTHSVALDGVTFEQAVVIRPPNGADVPPTAVEQASGSGHHREAVLVFPPSPQPGPVRIVVKNVGGVAERTFTWEPSAQ